MSVLAIDELGYPSYGQRAADLLFEFISRRHEAHKPVLISSNLAFRDWTTVFPHATCTVALVDRLTHRADVIRLDAESWRRKESIERNERNAADAEASVDAAGACLRRPRQHARVTRVGLSTRPVHPACSVLCGS